MIRRALRAVLLALAAPAVAQEAAQQAAPTETPDAVPEDVRVLFEALRLPEIVDVISSEGQEDAEALAQTMFQAAPPPSTWTDMVADIYDPEHLEAELLVSLSEELEGVDMAPMIAFFENEPGRTLIAREVETRVALSDEEAEEAAREAAAVAAADRSSRFDLLTRYVEALDLIEYNVVGSLNSNYAYVSGLLDGGALGGDMTESDVLSDLWMQEPQIRADTSEWVMAFLLSAYEPVPDADIEALIAFSETEPGQVLNRAIFGAFDERFFEISRALGLVAARYMTTEEL